jgi:glycosyltransferase involved in cell wall biosynthesis
MIESNKISVFLVVKNEEKNIRRVLESVRDFDEIVVVDSGSTDRTLEMAREYTDHVVHHPWQGMGPQKEYARSLCHNDWVLNLDGDEELKQEMPALVDSPDVAGVSIPFREHTFGRLNHPGTRMNRHTRLFRRSLGHYGSQRDHERLHLDGRVVKARGVISHFNDISLEVRINKINRYSSSVALDKQEAGVRYSALKLLLVMPLAFFKFYLLKRNFLNGVRGFVMGVNVAFYAFAKEAKLHELEIISARKIDGVGTDRRQTR